MSSADAPPERVTGDDARRPGPSGPLRQVAAAAVLIAVLTVLARVAGFGRTMVFAWAVGANDLSDIYLAANLIPNIIFEIVAGGALASLVVPVLAGAIAAGDRAAVARITGALLTWTLLLLVPLAVVTAVAAPAIVAAVAGADSAAGGAAADQVEAGARMLQIFAPQLPLYGIGIVLTGVLQAHRRFAWPVLAPLLSSLTVAATYAGFVLVDGRGATVAELSGSGLWVLAGGTTAGVVVLAGCLVPQVARLRLRIRPGWRFDPQTRSRLRGLAAAGAITVAAQQLALLVVLYQGLAGPDGAWALFAYGQTIFLLPWAVLAVPLATAAYPGLAEAAVTGRHRRYAVELAAATRGVVLLSLFGTAALVALATPVAALFGQLMPQAGGETTGPLAAGLVAFAPGLLGYGLFAVLTRALYARGRPVAAAVAAVTGWATVALAAVALSGLLRSDERVVALTAAHSIGLTVLGIALVVAVARTTGRAALSGVARAVTVGLVAAALAAVAGWATARGLLPPPDPATGAAVADPTVTAPPGIGRVLGSGMLAAVVVAGVFTAAVWWWDRRDVRPAARRLARRLTRRWSPRR